MYIWLGEFLFHVNNVRFYLFVIGFMWIAPGLFFPQEVSIHGILTAIQLFCPAEVLKSLFINGESR